ncbi:oxidoreductase, 2OG-Fe(II) oxygenase family, putative [Trichophyton verrucosum HKI 0517]|uniref:Oxidoreductase, 2OG-Fe(II) oxygenase family, putative n=1 Tax=Trichophyton verrucosum (strain HKI 0517) TaxID=663202 RepID=D4D8J0_TRIVH|nr:oxidoreductase, 2OG-Fe(II) oxygenase family, putative [Trichophyton verrucosum HKI 0517]EFE41858.1 oxidoreductase, 2OG-Fe(II) oxygenase family, putative [Trichophyton verrucosum HKI 0517]
MVSNSQCQFLTWVRKASRSRKQNHLDHYQQKAFEIEKDFNYSSSSISSEGTERQSLDRNHQHISSPAKISLARLIANDAAEADRLLLACRELGGFYLDLTAADLGEDVMSDADRLFGLGRDVFNLPEDEKREYDMVKFGGYYGIANTAAYRYKGYRNRALDFKEFYTVSKDEILGIQCPTKIPQPQPQPIQSSLPLIQTYIRNSHAIISLILSRLASALDLPPESLKNIHRRDANSGDQIRWIKLQASKEARPPPENDVLLDEHSDSNSVTLIFNQSGGLQFRSPQPDSSLHNLPIPRENPIITTTTTPTSTPPTTNPTPSPEPTMDFSGGPNLPANWIPANPLPGHCIILMGEQLAKLTEGGVRANVHRVCAVPGMQTSNPRYSLVYFSRPEDDVILKQLAGIPVVPRPMTAHKSSRELPSQCKRIGKVFEGKEWMGWVRPSSPRFKQKR